jgi:hypothetical protein
MPAPDRVGPLHRAADTLWPHAVTGPGVQHRSGISAHALVILIGTLSTQMLHAAGLPWEIWESPARIATLDAGNRVLQRSSHCLDGCRYDRSNAGPADQDNFWPARWLYREGDEAIVFDDRGPGALTRIWMTTGFGTSTCIDPGTRVRFYVDGSMLPTVELALAALFDGSTSPFTWPLAGDRLQSSGGFVSHVPIAYAQGLRISLIDADNGGVNPCTGTPERLLWFQFQHHQLVPGTPVVPFVAGLDAPGWRDFLAHAGDDPWNAMLAPQNGSAVLAPTATLELASRSGSGWLRGIRLQLPRVAYALVNLRVRIDGETAIDLPLADFFATPVDADVAPRGVLFGEDASGWLYAWFPMPFAEEAIVELVADAALPAALTIDSSISFDSEVMDPSGVRFRANLVDTCAEGGDITLYAARGAGKLIGISARYRSIAVPPSPGFLEGDERAYVDDATAPAWYGTGIEDFFDGGFYFDQGGFTGPLSGASLVRSGIDERTAVWRLLLDDPLTHARALRLTQEVGAAPWEASPMCVRAVAYAYLQSRPLLVALDAFEIGAAAAAAAHAYAPPPGADCAPIEAQFADEPPTTRIAQVCRYASGSSTFTFRFPEAAPPLQLSRVFDTGAGIPGSIAGAPPARIRVNGIEAGRFPPAMANPARRWQRQSAYLDVDPIPGELQIEIVPEFTAGAAAFSESAWELHGGWVDTIFADAFESP